MACHTSNPVVYINDQLIKCESWGVGHPEKNSVKDSAEALVAAVAAGLGVPMKMMSQDNVVVEKTSLNGVTVSDNNKTVEQMYTEFKQLANKKMARATDGEEPYYHYDWGKGDLPPAKIFDARGVDHGRVRRLNIETGQAVKLTNWNEERFYLIDKPKVYFDVDQPFCAKPDVEVPSTPARKITVDRI